MQTIKILSFLRNLSSTSKKMTGVKITSIKSADSLNENSKMYKETKAKEGCKVFKLSKTNDNSDIIEMIVPILQRGGVVALPTDTIYGLACLAQSTEGIEKLYKIKGREESKPIAICVGESYDVCQWTRFPQPLMDMIGEKTGKVDDQTYQRSTSPGVLNELLRDFLPGPVTVITERSQALNTDLNPKSNTVGVRVPDDDFIRALTNRLREPIALTSANFSGEESSLQVEDFRKLYCHLDAVVDGGTIGSNIDHNLLYARAGSTVFTLLPDGNSFKVNRAGCAYEETVNKLKGKWGLKHEL